MNSSYDRFKQVFFAMQDFAFIIDASTNIVDANLKVEQRNLTEKKLSACFSDDGKPFLEKSLQSTPNTFRSDFYFSPADRFYTQVSVTPLPESDEPLFLVIIGGIVGFIFASILLPIFQMVKTLKH